MTDTISLICLIRGDLPEDAFIIKIGKTRSVYDLKEIIKTEKYETFRNYDTNDIELWCINARKNDHDRFRELGDHIYNENDVKIVFGGMKLDNPELKIVELFRNQPQMEFVHIIVKFPSDYYTKNLTKEEIFLHSNNSRSHFLEFDVSALQQVAFEKLHKECTFIRKLAEGSFHKVYLLTMDDGLECIARVAFPTFRRLKTESEVATLQYIAEHTSIPVPKIYAWESDPENIVGAEYILMEKIPGENLHHVWRGMSLEQKKDVLRQIIDFMLQLFHLTFEQIGSLYKDTDNTTYKVGPIVNDLFFNDERASMDLDRGPWISTSEYLSALIQREIDYLNVYQAAVLEDEDLEPDDPTIMNTCKRLASLVPFFTPNDTLLNRFCLWHTDMGLSNIMVDGSHVTGMIDWESSGIYPAWSCATYPRFITGKDVAPDVDLSIYNSESILREVKDAIDNTQLRPFFLSEVKVRDPMFLEVMEKGTKYRDFEREAILLWEFYHRTNEWMKNLRDNWNQEAPFPINFSGDED